MLTQPTADNYAETSDPKRRAFGMAIREALRIALRAVEDYYDLPRSFETQQERRERRG